ncbi:MAG TPA: BadF/BadG/BcrA/BcrD ATPase family protein, partial [Longimicrobiales bacterium]|nr:BadF/BadG/BcrA/BcrD ATPase family protein [Longimicrobiales bacterium]
MTAATAPVFVGVDGGGTTTRVLVVDSDGQPLVRVDGPASLVDSRHPRIAASVVARTTREALAEIGNPPVAALHAALAGAGRESVRSAVERALTEDGVARAVAVGTDVEAAFRDAFGSGPGVLLMAGTGSVAWGRSEEGSEARAGGWGGLMGDEGSGWSIGLAALRAVARASDGRGRRTALSGALEDRLGRSGPEELILWAGTASKGEVAGLTEPVVAAAGAGDAVARRILDEAVTDLLSH